MPGALQLWIRQPKMPVFIQLLLHLQGCRRISTFKAKMCALRGEELFENCINRSLGIDMNEHVRSLCRQGRLKEALHILQVMDKRGARPDSSVYACLLQECTNMKCLPEGKLVHAHMADLGFIPDIHLGTRLATFYAKCGSLMDARYVFDRIPNPDVVSWTAMIAAYSRHGQHQEALNLFCQMQHARVEPDHFTFASALPTCANLGALKHGKELHGSIIVRGYEPNVFAGSALLDMYVKCGRVEDAHQVFDKMPLRNVVSCNAMIAGYAQNGLADEALKVFQKMAQRNVVSWTAVIAACARGGHDEAACTLFYQMQWRGVKPDQFAFASILPACANLQALAQGKEVHEDTIRGGFQSNTFVGNALIDMYAKCGRMEDACNVFDKLSERNVVSWNSMIAGYVQNGQSDKALNLFCKLPERNAVSWTAMIAGYAESGLVDKATELFQKMPEPNLISWNTLITGCAQNGHFSEALKLFQQMQMIGVMPDSVTFASVLPACANLATLKYGKDVHQSIITSGFQSDTIVGNALVDMYAKCGSIEDAHKVFDKMHRRNVISWTAMIVGLGMHGRGKEALQLFEQMQHSDTKPNHVTFLGVLSACCHAGLVDDGRLYFDCMSKDYHITPSMEHYCCMVDLLGRAGCLDEAYDFITKMPIKPDASIWGSLLSACRIHANVELAEKVAENLFELDAQNDVHCVLLSNVYAASGRWVDVERIRKMMKDGQVKKKPGCSWIEFNNKVCSFLVGDQSHSQNQTTYGMLERLPG